MSNRRLLTGAERNRKRPAASASSSAQHPAHGAAELPEYEPPDCPLDETSRRALAALVNNSELGEYPRRLGESYELLKDSVRDINDHHVLRRGQLKNMQEKRRERDADAEPTEHERQLAEAVEALRDAVPELTKSCEAAVRAIIDWQVELADEEKALDEATTRLEEDFALYAEAVRENPDDEPPRPAGAHMLFAEAREALQAEYAATTMYQRYGQNNEYIHFKKLWHDAVHADDGKPLPEAARWFGRDGAPEDADDEDDDLIIAGEIQDFRCPLSMQVMTNPYTSPVCKHTFEKAAIYEYLGPHPKRVVQCPQTGCEKTFSKKDLYYDDVVVRRIQRAKEKAEREALQDEDMDDDKDGSDGDGGGGDDDDDDDNDRGSMQVTAQRRVKREGRGRGDALVDSNMQGI